MVKLLSGKIVYLWTWRVVETAFSEYRRAFSRTSQHRKHMSMFKSILTQIRKVGTPIGSPAGTFYNYLRRLRSGTLRLSSSSLLFLMLPYPTALHCQQSHESGPQDTDLGLLTDMSLSSGNGHHALCCLPIHGHKIFPTSNTPPQSEFRLYPFMGIS